MFSERVVCYELLLSLLFFIWHKVEQKFVMHQLCTKKEWHHMLAVANESHTQPHTVESAILWRVACNTNTNVSFSGECKSSTCTHRQTHTHTCKPETVLLSCFFTFHSARKNATKPLEYFENRPFGSLSVWTKFFIQEWSVKVRLFFNCLANWEPKWKCFQRIEFREMFPIQTA